MNKKLIAGLSAVALIAAGASGAALHGLTAEPKVVTVEKLVPVEKLVEVTKEVKVEVPVEKLVNVSVEDTEFLKLVCDRQLYDDLLECKKEITAEDAALKLAFSEVKSELANELEDADLVEDERDVRIIKVFSDFEDVEVTESDFDSNEYEFEIKVKVEDEDADEKFEVLATVEVEDGEAKIVDVELI